MPSADSTPIDRQPAPFDPKNLRRSVIAVPLREAIVRELEETEAFVQKHPEFLKGHNTAVFYRGDTAREVAASHKRVLRRLEKAEKELREVKELSKMEPQRIDPLLPELGKRASLASLRGRVISLLLAMDAASDPLPGKDGKDEPAPPAIDRIWPTRFEVIIDINLNFKPPEGTARAEGEELEHPDARHVAKKLIARYIEQAKEKARIDDPDQGIDLKKTRVSTQYVFARLEGKVIQELVAIDQREARALAENEIAAAAKREQRALEAGGQTGASEPAPGAIAEVKQQAAETLATDDKQLTEEEKRLTARFRTIHHIWPDFQLRSCITQSISTVKADAAHRSFTASGKGITWAVLDSGIDGTHPHFRLHKNVDLASTYHEDFTDLKTEGSALRDEYGHGTHVAGIIAGEQSLEKGSTAADMICAWHELDEGAATEDDLQASTKLTPVEAISGIAPQCQLVSLKVLDRFGMGNASSAITAIAHVQEVNHHGRELHIQGVNLSLGYPFDPKWFACGHSPLCVEVNRLVRSGVVVVVAAGNSGYGTLMMKDGKTTDACLDLSINDPGNAERALTVGSTHRDMPHMYGVSYFSSKGPTGDGRCKPDLLAPGEKIVSCASPGSKLVKDEAENKPCNYFETSGTSMAAPHVSGAVAAFLSIRKEFIGEPERVKKIFTSTATDLGRDRYFQGYGLVDLMRAIQSV